MLAVYKYPLPLGACATVSMPRGARVLCVQAQHDAPCVWALVDPDAPLEPRHFRIVATGQTIDADALVSAYHGTFQLHGALVFHLFEAKP